MKKRILRIVMAVIILLTIFFTVTNFFPSKAEAKLTISTYYPMLDLCMGPPKDCAEFEDD